MVGNVFLLPTKLKSLSYAHVQYLSHFSPQKNNYPSLPFHAGWLGEWWATKTRVAKKVLRAKL